MHSFNINDINRIATEAGKRILDVYNSDSFGVELKSNNSPLTKADQVAHEFICEALSNLQPNIPILSEENKEITAYETRKDWNTFWLVDPLDGTKEFIKRNGQFTVNIALIENGIPVLGVVYAPVLSTLYYAEKNKGAYRIKNNKTERLLPKQNTSEKIRVVASNSHLNQATQDYIATLSTDVEYVKMGSSLKFCVLAEGAADIYPRLGPTMEWDTGAAHIVVKEAGMEIYNHETGTPLIYNKENLLNPSFVAK